MEGREAEGKEARHQQDGPDGLGSRCAPRPREGLRGRGQAPDHQGVAHQVGQGGQDEAGQHQHHAVDEKLVEAVHAGRVVADQLAVDVVRAGEDQGGQPLDGHLSRAHHLQCCDLFFG